MGKMNNKKVNQIIENYRPCKGFFDLSIKPKTLAKDKYAKLLNIQNILAEAENNKEYLMKFEPTQYEDWKEISALYQAIVFQHWNI